MEQSSDCWKKKLAAALCALLVILYIAPMVGIVFCTIRATGGLYLGAVLPFLLLYALIGAAVVAGVLCAFFQRLREIDGGEEEQAKKY